MAHERTRTKGTGKAGHHSSRYAPRAVVKAASKRSRRREDRIDDLMAWATDPNAMDWGLIGRNEDWNAPD